MQAERDDSKAAAAWDELWVLTALDMNGIGSWDLDVLTGVTKRTPAHDRIFGYAAPLDRWTVETFLAHVHPEDCVNIDALLQDRAAQLKDWTFECRIRRADDDETRWIIVVGRPICDSNGSLLRYIGTVKDITDRKIIEKQLHEAQKLEAVGQLTAGVSHYFNNLLAVMMVNVDMLRDVQDMPAEAEPMIQNTLRAVSRGADLTRHLLAFARKWALMPRTVDLGQEVKQIAADLRKALPGSIQIQVLIDPQPVPVTIDLGQLNTALANVAANARDAMDNEGLLSILVGIEDREAPGKTAKRRYGVVTVRDTGRGMTAQVAAKAFDPFFTTKDVGQGMGLGLSMVYGFLEQSQGRAELSSAEGEGTVVKMLFPLTTARPEEVAKS